MTSQLRIKNYVAMWRGKDTGKIGKPANVRRRQAEPVHERVALITTITSSSDKHTPVTK